MIDGEDDKGVVCMLVAWRGFTARLEQPVGLKQIRELGLRKGDPRVDEIAQAWRKAEGWGSDVRIVAWL